MYTVYYTAIQVPFMFYSKLQIPNNRNLIIIKLIPTYTIIINYYAII